jgi:hypothetical protein
MRRMLFTAVAATALAIPGVALASHQSEHQARGAHHRVHRERHHTRAHVLRFGAVSSSSGAAGAGTVAPAPAATTAEETAGTIAAFSNGTLTIALNDGSSVSGKVTESTTIECQAAIASAASDGGQGEHGEGGRSDDGGHDGEAAPGAGGQAQDEDRNDDGNDEGPQEAGDHCTTAALLPGAVVREAELSLSSAGGVWQKVELAR